MSIPFYMKLIIIALSGVLLSFSSPGYDLWFLAWICISPLFIFINNSKNLPETLLISFVFGFSYGLGYLHWLFSLHPLTWLGLSSFESLLVSSLAVIVPSLQQALLFVLFAILFYLLKKALGNDVNKSISSILLTCLLWVIVFNKIGSSKYILGFPWALIEYSQYKNFYLIQIADQVGSIFISFLIVYANIILANFLSYLFFVDKIGKRYIPKDPGQIEFVVYNFTIFIIIISSCIFYGVNENKKYIEGLSPASKRVVLLQGNLPIKATRGRNLDIDLALNTYGKLISMTRADIVIAPEGSLPVIINEDYKTRRLLKEISKRINSDLIFGSYYSKYEGGLTNCAVCYKSNSGKFKYYEKEKLVPFGEYVPLYSALPRFLKRFADYAVGNGFFPGDKNRPISFSRTKMGISICFELIFPDIIRERNMKGANILVNLSDLSWFSSDLIKKQFIAFGVFRAIENRKPLVIATNSGISTFIEPTGKIKSLSKPNSKGVLIDWVNPNKKVTTYSKYGW